MTQPTKEQVIDAYRLIRTEQPWKFDASDLSHHRVLPYATRSPWLDDPEFLSLYEKIKGHTLVDLYRCYELWLLAKQTGKVEGVVLEVGVWRGGTGAVLAQATKALGKKVYLADTFTGVVKAGEKDTLYKGGEHADTSLAIVNALMSSLAIDNIQILEGIFPDDTQHLLPENIALLHCDVDVYSSTKDIVDWCLPRMNTGAMLVFDDYGFFGCEGVTTFCDELKLRNDLIFTHNLNGHAVFVKI